MAAVTVRIERVLDAPADRVWDLIQRLSTFRYVCRGLLGVPALRGREEVAEPGRCESAWLFLFHVIPLHRHTILVQDVDAAERTLRTEEHGGMVRSWRHTLHAEPLADGRTRYSDTVEIDGGPLTPLLVGFAHVMYRYRQRRWRELVRLPALTAVNRRSHIPATADMVWERVISPEGINDELRPYLRMTVPDGVRDLDATRVAPGTRLGRSWLLLFGVLPFEYDDITVAAIEPGRRFLERSTMLSLRVWEHERTITPEADGCVVKDRLSFEPRLVLRAIPGFRRLLAAALDFVFRHRHRRLAAHFSA
jgi:ligand-binding SRPBCC domain-containing protein